MADVDLRTLEEAWRLGRGGGIPPIQPLEVGVADADDMGVAKLDPVLKFLLAQLSQGPLYALEIHVLVWIDLTRVDRLIANGLQATSVAGDIVAGRIPLNRLADLAGLPEVRAVEGPRPMRPQLDRSVPEIFGSAARRKKFGTGAGAIVGIIDSGIWFTHHAFRKGAKKTRITALWAQELKRVGRENSPVLIQSTAGFDKSTYRFGVRYSAESIERALGARTGPVPPARHGAEGISSHGSEVAAIAAGTGRTRVKDKRPRYSGVAPEADLMVASAGKWPSALPLTNRGTDYAPMESPKLLDAANFLLMEAREVGKPIAINISQGDNFGPHDGTSLLERGLGHIAREPGCVVVVSAGNNYMWKCHASGTATASRDTEIRFEVNEEMDHVDYMDIWYDGDSALRVAVTPPGVRKKSWISPHRGDSIPQYLPVDADTVMAVESVMKVAINDDHRIAISLRHANGCDFVTHGMWTIHLRATGKEAIPFHAWIGGPAAVFADADPTHTIMSPGCSTDLLTVGAHEGPGVKRKNPLPISASGPTRKGDRKPDLCAPGCDIITVETDGHPTPRKSLYGQPVSGTSYAAPHVTGAAALILSCNHKLTTPDMIKIVSDSARKPTRTKKFDANRWGAGTFDAAAAVKSACRSGKAVIRSSTITRKGSNVDED